MKKIVEKVYEGNVKIEKSNEKEWNEKLKGITAISGYLHIYSNATLKADSLKSVGGDLHIYSNATLNSLKSVGGDLHINSKNPEKLEHQLWTQNKKNKWYLCQTSSDWLFKKNAKFEYRLNNVTFERELFQKARRDKLTAKEVFAIQNLEQRRIAYEFMDKAKMKELADYKILEEKKDNYENIMQVVSFSVDGFDKPFKYLRCVCPSTKREYFLETQQDTTQKAKAMSFGKEEISFDEEW